MALPVRQAGAALFILGILGFLLNPLSAGNIITYASLVALVIGLILLIGR